jgi:murein tripeptide amidase MpaA
MEINSDFECGNIIVNELSDTEALLSIRPDTGAEYYQWFYFRVTGTPDTTRTFQITNAAGASYEKAWNGYRVLASYNGNDWLRIPTEYDGSNLTFKHSATESTTSYAFFVPYFAAQRETLLHDCESSPLVTRRSIGKSYQGKSIDMVVIGDENRDTKKIWVITRQHAGESMAEWATEGMLRRFIDANDSVSQALLNKATIYVVPNINPDGSALGNLRANAAGVDLNRAWAEPTDKCPEIIAIQKAMKEVGVDYFLDMHGDEERPFIWIAHTDVEQSPEQKRLQVQFEQELVDRNPEIRPAPKELQGVIANMGLATNYMASTFNCLSWITELPFREPEIIENNPDSMLPDGCLRFGRTCVDALNEVV